MGEAERLHCTGYSSSQRKLYILKIPVQDLADTADMEAACMWFIYAADRLWENVQHGRTYTDAGTGPGCEFYSSCGWRGHERG